MKQLLEGLKYLHEEKGVAHRDVKPDNIIIAFKTDCSGKRTLRLKLCDFNVAKSFKGDRSMMTKTGLEEWSAPEMQGGNSYSEKVDLWSAGCVLYFILAG
jgi:serine/threonine protein kinase